MEMFYIFGSACWLGLLTSISPCPLATNIAAVAYIGSGMKSPHKVLITGAIYTVFRAMTYIVVTWLIAGSVIPFVKSSFWLESNMSKIMGPLLILVGMFMWEMINLPFFFNGSGSKLQEKLKDWNYFGAALLGILFALSFCPVSAALFFGILIPMSIAKSSYLNAPFAFGLGTAIPVIVFTIILAFSSHLLSSAMKKVTKIEKYLRLTTGTLFIIIGLYYTMTLVFKIF